MWKWNTWVWTQSEDNIWMAWIYTPFGRQTLGRIDVIDGGFHVYGGGTHRTFEFAAQEAVGLTKWESE